MTKLFSCVLVLGVYAPLLVIMSFVNPYHTYAAVDLGIYLVAFVSLLAVSAVPALAANLAPETIIPQEVNPVRFPLGYFVPYLLVTSTLGGFWIGVFCLIMVAIVTDAGDLLPAALLLRLIGWKFYQVRLGWRTVTVMSHDLPAQTMLVPGGEGEVALAPIKLRMLTNYLAVVV